MNMFIPKAFRQILALILCLAMLLPVVAVPGAAEEAAVPTGETTVTEAAEASGEAEPEATETLPADTEPEQAAQDLPEASVEESTGETAENQTEDLLLTAADDGITTVIADSDFQNTSNDHTAGAAVVTEFMNRFVNSGYTTLDGFLFAGDYDYGFDDSAVGKSALEEAVLGVYSSRGLTEDAMIWVQGNHDPDSLTTDGTLSTSGAHDAVNYGVYVINEKDYMWYNNDEATVKNTAAALDTYLDAKASAKYTKPIFVISHLPLHYNMRTKNDGDGQFANYIFDVLNEAGAKGLNIIFLFGHNHSNGWDDYLGGSAVYLAKGDSINVAQASKTSFAVKTLNFTYMNAGYVSYYRNVNTGAETELTMTVFQITEDTVTTARYTVSGIHDLKSAGVTNSYQGENGYTPNTGVYSSPQTIVLNKTFKQNFTDTDTGVSVFGEGLSGLSVTKVSADVPGGYSAYQTYDIKPSGYTQGTPATVTITLGNGFDSSRPVYVIDHGKSKTITCAIIGGKVSFTTDHFSLYTVAQTDDSGISASGTLKPYLVRVTALESGVPYVISDYKMNWVLTSTPKDKGSHTGLLLSGEPSADTSHVWYIVDGKIVYGAADSTQYLQIGFKEGTSYGNVVIDALAEGSELAATTRYSNSNGGFEILNSTTSKEYLNRHGGTDTDDVATAYTTPSGSYWSFDKIVSDSKATLSVYGLQSALVSGEVGALGAAVLVDGVAVTEYTLSWSSADESVASVSGGAVTAVAPGETVITVTLTKADGHELVSPVSVEIPVVVVSERKSAAGAVTTAVLNPYILPDPSTSITSGVPYVVVSKSSGFALIGDSIVTSAAGKTGLELRNLASGEFDQVWYYSDGNLLYGTPDSGKYLVFAENKYVQLGDADTAEKFDEITLNTDGKSFTVKNSNIADITTYVYLNQYGGGTNNAAHVYSMTGSSNEGSAWYFYEMLPERTITLTLSPAVAYVSPGGSVTLTPTVQVDGETVGDNAFVWASENTGMATVSDGVVTGVGGGSVTITAYLTVVDGIALEVPIPVRTTVKVATVISDDTGITASMDTAPYLKRATTLEQGVPYVITSYQKTNWALTGTTKEISTGGKLGMQLVDFYDSDFLSSGTYGHMWYYNGTSLQYGAATGSDNYLGYDNTDMGLSANEAGMVFNSITLNNDNATFTIGKDTQYLNLYGGSSSEVGYPYSQDGNSNSGSKWYFNTIVPPKNVTLKVSPAEAAIRAGNAVKLTPTVTMDGVATTSYTLNWTSSDESVATVYEGVVTAKEGGTVTITATVTTVNGETLPCDLLVQVPVTVYGVTNVTIDSKEASVAQRSSTQADTGAKLTVTYADGTVETIPVTVGMLTDSDGKRVSAYSAGTYENLTVTYAGYEVCKDFKLNVIARVQSDYPAYPEEGSVSVDKSGAGIDFQSSGIAQIELSATGVPSKKGADVIIMLDTSGSMRNEVSGTTITRLEVLTDSLNDLLNRLQTDGVDGEPMDIRVAVADFNGYYLNNNSPYLIESNDTTINNAIRSEAYYQVSSNQIYTGDHTLTAGAFVDVHELGMDHFSVNAAEGKQSLVTHGGTNYDYAFDAVYQLGEAINEVNAEDGENRDLFVIFMSDGAPFQYNYFSSQSSADGSANWNNWLMGTFDSSMFADGANQSYYHPKGLHWMAEAIKGQRGTFYNVIRKNDPADTDEDNWITVEGLGATMYSIGFCLEDDKAITVAAMDTVIRNIASSSNFYFRADTADDLQKAFDMISGEIVYAATNAYFVDEMGKDYDIQLATSTYRVDIGDSYESRTIAPTIEVRNYSVYTRQEAAEGLCEQSQIGQRKKDAAGNEIYQLVEKVTFNEGGTEACSNLLGSGNILTGGVINASTFWYNTNKYVDATNTGAVQIDTNGDGVQDYTLTAETFYWKLGTISTTELTLSYYVYLTGSMEGDRPAGTYDTNEHAELNYVNYLGHSCQLSVPTPKLPWQQASVGYGFYLVDSNGRPIINQTTGETGSFDKAVRITQPVYMEFLLNSGSDIVAEIAANGVLPEGYTLFDEGAEYDVSLNSNGSGSYTITVTREDGKQTTYVVGIESNPITGSGTTETADYVTANTVVWFGVVATVKSVPDTVVIDFGLPVEIDVMANDVMMGDYGKLAYVGTSGGYTPGENEKLWQYLQGKTVSKTPDFRTEEVSGTYGTLAVVKDNGVTNGKVRYTLSNTNGMQMKEEESFVYAVDYAGTIGTQGYYYSTVTVIPATSIYYEEGFVSFRVKNMKDDTVNTAKSWSETDPNASTADQAQDRPGSFSFDEVDANNIYGYDGAYLNMATYSMGSARRVTVDPDTYAEAEFTFWGTGFDVVSLTSNNTGTITVSIYDADAMANGPLKTLMVDTYYGYKYEGGKWVVDSGASDTLYQVPVMKVEMKDANGDPVYGRYTAVITVSYASFLDHNKADKSYDFYLDAIRIYDPANDGSGNTTIENAYKDDGEGWPSYLELRNMLIKAESFDALGENDTISGIVFIDNTKDTSQNKVNEVADYTNYGPNNEVYLAPGQAISFKLNGGSNVAAIHLAMKNAMAGATKVSVYGLDSDGVKTAELALDVKTATDLYYDITALDGKTVVIHNTGDSGILSVTNLKITHTQKTAEVKEEDAILLSRRATEAVLLMLNGSADTGDSDSSKPETGDSTGSGGNTGNNGSADATEPTVEVTEPSGTQPEQSGETPPENTLDPTEAPAEPEATEAVTQPEESENLTEPQPEKPAIPTALIVAVVVLLVAAVLLAGVVILKKREREA